MRDTVTFWQRTRSNPSVRRIASGTAANLLGKIWIFLQQLIAIPLLTTYWGSEGYGLWLLVSTASAYVLLADFGLAPTLSVSLAKALANKDQNKAGELFRTGNIAAAILTSAFAAITALLALMLAMSGAWNGTLFGPFDIAAAVVAMSAYAVLIAQMNVVNAVYRATYRYVRGTLALDVLVPIETAVMFGVTVLGGNIAAVAVSLLTVRFVGLVLFYWHAVFLEPWAAIRPAVPSRTSLQELWKPSLAAFALTLGNAITLQGLILAIGSVAGPAAVATFGAARVLTRAPLQLSGLLPRAILPELIQVLLAGKVRLARRMMWLGVGFSATITLPFLALMLVAGPTILIHLSSSEVIPSLLLIGLLATAATLNALWNAAATLLIAQNRQGSFSYWYLAFAILGALATLAATPHLASLMAAGAMVAIDAATIVVATIAIHRMLSSDLPASSALPNGARDNVPAGRGISR